MAGGPGGKSGRGAVSLAELALRVLLGALFVLTALFALVRWRALAGDAQALQAEAMGTLRLASLASPVSIARDARGIPHIDAERGDAAWFAVGFVHAQDRLAQLLSLRRRALGRSAELEGEGALAADRLARLLEIGRASQAAADALPRPSQAVLDAYAAGVNAQLERVREGRATAPPQLAEPIASVEPWRPADSLAVVKLLSWCMGGTLETTLVLDELIQRLDSVSARPFFPGRASIDFGAAPSLPMLRSFDASPSATAAQAAPGEESEKTAVEPSRARAGGAAVPSTRRLCRGIGEPTGAAWIVAPRSSEDGSPLLLADWQLAPSVPALFYELEVSGGGLSVVGATLPGSPIVWIGRTPALAWAALPAGAPIADLFIESLAKREGYYLNGSRPEALTQREETIRYVDSGGAQQVERRLLRSTRHGPLIDLLDGASHASHPDARESTARALAWTGARTGDGLTSMLALMQVERAESVASALASHHEPVVAVAYADRHGAAGVQVAGWLPHRPLPTGLVPVEGRLASFDWRHRVAIEALPRLVLSDRAFLVVADQEWPAGDERGGVEFLWRPGDRAARIESELVRRLGQGRLDLRRAAEMFADHGSGRAPEVVRALLALARRAGPLDVEAEEIAEILERWDGGTDANSRGAAAYHLVVERLLAELLRAPFGADLFERYLAAPHVRAQDAVERLMLRADGLRRAGGWTDEARVARAARRSLREAWVVITHRLGPARERWEWGELHRLRFLPLSEGGLRADFLYKGLRTGGSPASLDAAWHRAGLSLEVEAASLYRVAMDLSSPDRVLSNLAPGQSEHPGHPHFEDGIERFRSAHLTLLTTDRLAIEEESAVHLLLEPAR